MAKTKIWHVGFAPGAMEERTDPYGPYKKAEAIEIAKRFEASQWRAWVFDESGRRIFQSAAEIKHKAGE